MQKLTNEEARYLSHYFQASRDKLVCLVSDVNAKTGESLNSSVGVPSWKNWRTVKISGEIFYIMLDHFMTEILEEDLFERAHEKFSDRFVKGEPDEILEALWEVSNFDNQIGNFEDFLRRYSFFSISSKSGKTLKLPLFRFLNLEKGEFSGGILHLLKHFQVNGKAVSTGTQQHEFTEAILLTICEAFYFGIYKDEQVIDRVVGEKSFQEFNRIFEFEHEGERFRMITRYGGLCDLFFISTIIPLGKVIV